MFDVCDVEAIMCVVYIVLLFGYGASIVWFERLALSNCHETGTVDRSLRLSHVQMARKGSQVPQGTQGVRARGRCDEACMTALDGTAHR